MKTEPRALQRNALRAWLTDGVDRINMIRYFYLISAIFCVFAHTLQAEGKREAFRAETTFDRTKSELVITVIADEKDISVVQLSISRPYADAAGITGTKDFIPSVIQHDEADTASTHALINEANKKVRLYIGNCPVPAKGKKEIRLPAKWAPDQQKCHIIVGAELLGLNKKLGVYLDAKIK